MLDQIFHAPHVRERLRGGEVGSALDDLAAFLRRRGHSIQVTQKYVRAAAHFGAWLRREQVPLATARREAGLRFLTEHRPRCRCPVRTGEQPATLRAAVDHLLFLLTGQRFLGRTRAHAGFEDPLLASFEWHLRETRGLAASTCLGYLHRVDAFLRWLPGSGPLDPARLTPADLAGYVTSVATRVRPGTTKQVGNALRSFIRYLQMRGLCEGRLTGAVPSVAYWRLSQLPKVLSDDQVRGLLEAFDQATILGRRDYAIALCLLQLGLRSSEVAQLSLDDFDWRSGTVRLAGKPRRTRLLPLPAGLARALVAYLRRGRPRAATRQVFVRHTTPVGGPLTIRAVRSVIRTAWRRAGIPVPSQGTHALRHTAATRLLRSGATLKDIADILGHRSIDTAAVYAKVDLGRLGDVASPWPGTRS